MVLSRIVIDKAAAVAETQIATATAVVARSKEHVVAGKTLKVLRKRVRANKRRLARR